MQKIFIYRDVGADAACVASLVAELRRHVGDAYHIAWADRHLLCRPEWQREAALLIFPGGRDVPYHRALQGVGNAHIREFVERGGSFLGLCAGGYYGSATVEFERGRPLEVVAERELKFFPGVARGPAYGLGEFEARSERGARVAQLHVMGGEEPTVSAAYYHGGCAFVDADAYPTVSVLARYAELHEQPAAIVRCRVGQGWAILSGVHPEYCAMHGVSVVPTMSRSMREALHAVEPQRDALFKCLLMHVGCAQVASRPCTS